MSNNPSLIMPQIKKIVFLMFEKRSLDNILGWLYPEGTNPDNVVPGDSSKEYDGLQNGSHSNPDLNGVPVPVTKLSDIIWREMRRNGWGVPYHDPYESLRAIYANDPRAPEGKWYGVMNQLYGNQALIQGLPSCQ